MTSIVSGIEDFLRRLNLIQELRPLVAFLILAGAFAAVVYGGLAVAVKRRWMRRSTAAFWAFVTPCVFGLAAFTFVPMLSSLWASFQNWDLIDPPTFAGLDNYQHALHDPLLGQAMKVTLLYAVASVPLQTVLSLGVALLLNAQVRGIYVFRTIWYLPSLVTGVAQTVLFLWVFNPDYGLVNGALRAVGIHGPGWFQDPNWALPAAVLMSLWTVGSNMIIYLAGLQDVPKELYEAVELDGAGRWRKLWHITLPQISPVIFFNVVVGIIAAMQTFTQGYVVRNAGGAPSNSLLFYVYYLFQNGFQFFKMGYASALAWILLLMILALTALVFRGSAFWVYYESESKRARRSRVAA